MRNSLWRTCDKDSLPNIDISYSLVIVDDEANKMIGKFKTVWGYVNTVYWFPLNENAP